MLQVIKVILNLACLFVLGGFAVVMLFLLEIKVSGLPEILSQSDYQIKI